MIELAKLARCIGLEEEALSLEMRAELAHHKAIQTLDFWSTVSLEPRH